MPQSPLTTPQPDRRALLPAIGPLTLRLLVAAFAAVALNATFWQRSFAALGDSPLMLIHYALAAACLTVFALTLVSPPRLEKPGLIFALLLGATASYYLDELGAVIDRDMIHNALTTTGNEARHLITPSFIGHMLIYGVLPAAVVLALPLKRRGIWRSLLGWLATLALSVALFVAVVAVDFKGISATIRNHRELDVALVPAKPIEGLISYARQRLRSATLTFTQIGLDAKKGTRIAGAGKPVLTLLVVGETSRAANWSLGGYDRPTNPELARRDIAYYSDVSSCGTSTAVSLPCMFAGYGQANHSYNNFLSRENLVDVFSHAGYRVEWIDNNTGHLKIGDRIPSRMIKPADDPVACARGECDDAAFLPMLDKILAEMTEDTVLVYHQIGSHGPAYYLRYPEGFRPFAPDCRVPEFDKCTQGEIINAYDNTIAYTDLMLASIIDRLAAADGRVTSAMLYVSDHGESLGENGLYLHGAPSFMAPAEQTHVPMVVWLSQAYQRAFGVTTECLRRGAGAPQSHDNFFHTALGLADTETAERDAGLDLTQTCRP